MYRVAVCDDDDESLAVNKELLQNYLAKRPRYYGNISYFTSPDALLTTLESGNHFDIYLLDVVMPDMDGIKLAREIRQKDQWSCIIYLTASPDYALQAYSVQALHYLLKPICASDLFDVMDRAVDAWEKNQDKVFPLRTKSGTEVIHISSMIYIEYRSHRLYIHLINGQIIESVSMRESFDHLLTELPNDSALLKIGASFMVNLNYIRKIENKQIIFLSGEVLLPPKNTISRVKKEFMNFLLRGGDVE